ncbi:PKD domain-containing protein [Candidatus Bathyarchaeota archaeon]|nr:MAG: PKD domain-containing protein [Candidatus Bathyarchaeota archaeon]
MKRKLASVTIILLVSLTFLLPSQLAFPVLVQATSLQVADFDSSWRLFNSPMLDILGYKIFITADLTYKQDISFSNDIDKSVLNMGDQVECSTSISPKDAHVVFFLTFHFGGNAYTFDYDLGDIQVPGTRSVTSIPIPVGELLVFLGLPPLPIHLNFDLTIGSQLSTDIYASGFLPTYGQFRWASSGTRESVFRLEGINSGIANVYLSEIKVSHEVTGKISISVPLFGTYTLYEFPVADVVSYSRQDNNVATYYRLVVSSQYSPATGSGWYYAGTVAPFAITSPIIEESVNTRHVFQGWSGLGTDSYSGSSNPATVSMNSPVTETALWETQYLLTIQTSQGGSTNPITGVYWESAGSSVIVSAIPTEGYVFENWILDGSVVSGDSDYSIAIDSPHTLSSQFNRLPSASFAFSPTENIRISDSVHFYDGSKDLDGTIISWNWDFGDDYTSTDQNPTHQYQAKGTYVVTLVVADDREASATTSQSITVIEPPLLERLPVQLWILLPITIACAAVAVFIIVKKRRKSI